MAIDDETIRLILDTQASTTAAHALATEVQQLNEYLRDLGTRFNEGAIGEKQFVTYFEDGTRALKERSAVLEGLLPAVDGLSGAKGGGGFEGLSRGVFQAERAFTALATGSGLARAGPMLEGLVSTLGGPAGLGFAMIGLEMAFTKIVPLVEKFFASFDDEKLRKAKEVADKFAEKGAGLEAKPGAVEKDVGAEIQRLLDRGIDVRGAAAAAIEGGPGGAIPTAEQEAGAQRYRAAGGMLGFGGALAAAGLATSPDQMREQLHQANIRRGNELIGRATAPGAVGKRAREELARLARDNPGAFPPEFEAFLRSVEGETPQAVALAEAAIEADDPDAQYAARHREGMARRNAALEQAKEEQKRTDRITQTYVDDAKVNEQALAQGRREAAQAAAQGRREAAHAQRDARREAHDADPSVMAAREREGLEDAARGIAPGIVGGMGLRPNRAQYESMIRGAVDRMPIGGGMQDLAAAIQQSATEGYRKAQEDMARMMRRAHQGSNTRGE